MSGLLKRIGAKTILGVFLVSLFFPSSIRAESWVSERIYGLRSFAGINADIREPKLNIERSKGNIGHFLLHPYAGSRWSNGFEIGIEGAIGTMKYSPESSGLLNSENVTILGATLNVYQDLFKIRRNKVFVGLGGGFAYWNKSIRDDKRIIVDNKIPAITHGEAGLKHPLKNRDLEVSLSFRFSHTSAMNDERRIGEDLYIGDRGVNTYGINFGIRWLNCRTNYFRNRK